MIKIYDGRNEFYQWDLNRKLIIDDTTVTEVHFCNKTSDCSLVVAVKDGGIVDVPNILLQTDWTINVYLYCGDCYTKEHTTFKVHKRSKPDDYIYTETEVKRWEDLAREIEEKTEQIDEVIGEVRLYDTRITDNSNDIANQERRLTNIERHISNDYFVTEANTAYNAPIPAAACPYAEVSKIGGMTHKVAHGNNYMTDLYVHSGDETLVTINADGSITVTNPDGGWYYFEIAFDSSAFSGKYFTAIGDISGIDLLTIATQYWDEETEYWEDSHTDLDCTILENEESRGYFEIYPKYEIGSWTFKPLIVDSKEDAKPRLIDTDVEALESIGANIFDISTATFKNLGSANNISSEIVDGVLKVITRTACATGSYYYTYYNKRIPLDGKSKVYVSAHCKPVGHEKSLFRLDIYEANTRAFILKEIWFETEGRYSSGEIAIPEAYRSDKYDLRVTFYSVAGRACSAGAYCEYSNIMISFGTDEYKPYRKDAVDTFTVPEELRAFLADKGWARGVKGYPNYIDFERGIFRQNTYRKVFDGTENWILSGTAQTNLKRMGLTLSPKSIAVANAATAYLICNSYEAVSGGKTWENTSGASITGGETLHIYDKNYQTVDTWKAHLAKLHKDGNPLIAEYALAEPIEIDISAYLTDENIIEVEAGGTIRAINADNNAAFTEIAYLVKEGSV